MKRQLLGVAAILLSISTYAQDNPLWMRYCAISPDGTTIAFTYKGDIYTVPSTGGRASQITTNPAHDTKPIWSPDGKKIAFASDRMGSMDIVSIWDNGLDLSDAQKRDMQFVQQVKGTKIIYCSIIDNIGKGMTPKSVTANWEENGYASEQDAINEFWGWPEDESNTEAVENAIRTYARAVADTLNKYGYDGFDIDYEPVAGPYHGNIVKQSDNNNFFIFVDELGKYFGPKSGTGKLLVIDGEPQRITDRPEIGHYFDYFIIQAYSCSGDGNLNGRLIDGNVWGPALISTFGEELGEEKVTNMTIMTENFEAVDIAMNGGYDFTDSYGNKMKSLEGMARWVPRNGFQKAGVGAYRMEAEFGTNPEYKNMRNAIQIMNPSSHTLLKK